VVVTDSGGIQEETTYLGVPCLTVRDNTERPVTITHGTNKLVLHQKKALVSAIEEVLAKPPLQRQTPPDLWDGHAAQRIMETWLQTS